MLNAHPYTELISEEVRGILVWWRHALSSVHKRIVSVRPLFPRYIIYSDASWSEKRGQGRIAALLFDRASGALLGVLSSPSPPDFHPLFHDISVIYGLELFALVASFAVRQSILACRQVTAYVDNDPASNGLAKGAAHHPIAQNFIRRFWQLTLKNTISVWAERAPSPVNWADMPTRKVKIQVESLSFREFPKIDELIKMFLVQWSDGPRMFFEGSERSRT